MTTPRRRKEIERLREEGRQAGLQGKHIQTCPYGSDTMNRGHWLSGYEEAKAPTEAEVKAERIAQRIEAEAYEGTPANTDWDSNFDVDKCIEILLEEYAQ